MYLTLKEIIEIFNLEEDLPFLKTTLIYTSFLFGDYFVMFSSIFKLESMEKVEEERIDNENEEKVMFEYSNVGDKREKVIKLVKPKSSFMNY